MNATDHEGKEQRAVTDSTDWQPPAGSVPPPAASPYAAPTASPPPPLGTPGWTPPPKPGLIPLRPLTLGVILGAAFQVLRRNPKPTFGFSLLVSGGVFLLTLVIVGVVSFFAIFRTLNATGADAEPLAAGSIAMIVLSALVPMVLGLVGGALLQGVIALEVARATLGEKLKLGGLLRAARGRIGALIGWTLLVALIVTVGLAVIAGAIALIIAFGGTAGLIAGILLAVVVGLALLAVSFWLSTKLCLVPTVLMLERLPLRAAIARSWSLTAGYFWRTLGIQLLVAFIIQTVAGIVTTPLSILLGFGAGLINPNGDQTGLIIGGIVLYVLTIVVSLVFGAIASVVQSATPALLYIDIRMRKEGLDLQLSRFVEARQAGDTSIPDPYLVQSGAVPPPPPGSTSPWS
jgi:hypothetical protein